MPTNHKRIVAAAGARDAPDAVLRNIMLLGSHIAKTTDYVCRTGGARGCDQAWAVGFGSRTEIMTPSWDRITPMLAGPDGASLAAATLLALSAKQRQDYLYDEAKRDQVMPYFLRNTQIVAGPSPRHVEERARFLLCWTANGKDSGGTGHTMRVAANMDVPILNLRGKTVSEIFDWLSQYDIPKPTRKNHE